MKSLLIIAFALIVHVGAYAQLDTLLGTTGMDIPHGMISTLDGSYIVYGTTDGSGQGQADFLLSKYSAADDLIWSYTYGSTGIENGHAINLIQVASGDLYLLGNWEQNAGDQDRAALIKLNADGDILWKRLLVGTGGLNADTFHDVVEIPDGNLLVAGWSSSLSTGNQDPVIVKFSPNGAFMDAVAFGGDLQDHGFEMIVVPNGFYLTHSGRSFGPGDRAAGLAFFDFNLNLIWNKMYGEVDEEAFSDIEFLSANTFLTTGRTESFGAERGFIMQLNDQGDIDWVKTVNQGPGIERITDFLLLPDFSYLVTISSTSIDKPIIARFNAAHQLTWAKSNPLASGGQAIFRGECMIQDPDGSIRAVLGFEGLGAGQSDIELVQFDAAAGPCGWTNVSLEVEDVIFLSEDVVPDEVVGGGLTDYVLSRNDLALLSEGIYDCDFEECELEGELILESPCMGDDMAFNYILDVAPSHPLSWEWTINSGIYTDSVPVLTISEPDDLSVTLILINDSVPGCELSIDAFVQVYAIPDFTITGPVVVCEGEEVDYAITTDVGDATWMNGDLGDELSILLTMDTLVEVFIDLEGCTDSAEVSVTVDQMPMGEISGPEILCTDDQVIEYTVDAVDYQTITWNNGSTELTSDYLMDQDSLITVELVNGICSVQVVLAVQVVSVPSIEIIGSDAVCEGDQVNYTLNFDDGVVTWMNGFVGNVLSITHTTDTLIEVMVDVQGCTQSAQLTVTVDAIPTGQITGPQLVCPNELAVYSINAEGFESLEWNNENSTLDSEYVIDQDTLITVEMLNGVCYVLEQLQVQMIPDIEVTLDSETTLCIYTNHTLTAAGGLDYVWSTGANGSSIQVLLDQDTTIWVSSSNGCVTDSDTVDITVVSTQASDLLDILVELEYGSNEMVDFPDDIPFDLIDISGAVLCSDCYSYTFTLFGNESYVLEHVDQYGCVTEIFLDLNPEPCTEIFLPSAFSPDGDEVNDFFEAFCYEPCVDYYSLKIYDRMGGLVFESVDLQEKWLGEGAVSSDYYVADEVYTYRLLYSLADSFEVIEKLGSVTVIR